MTRPSPPRHAMGVALAVLGALLAVLGWATVQDIRSGRGVVEQVMLAQAESIADLVTESGMHGFETYRLWEDEIAARLLDNARWVARRDSAAPVTSAELNRLARAHGLDRINVFDAAGAKVATSRLEEEEEFVARHDPRDYIGPILRGETRELRIGFKPARFKGGNRFAVAVARPRGGAVVVNVFADSMRAVLESVQPGHLLGSLGDAVGVRYVVLEQDGRMLAASAGAPDSAEAGAAIPVRLRPGEPPLVRELQPAGGRVYEVARAVVLPGAGATLLRVGLDPGPLDRARADIRWRALARALVMLAAATLAGWGLLAWQRQELLAREVARVRVELLERERDAQRTARLAAMGELASHVAHEIRNPLNTIQVTAQQLAREAGRDEDLRVRMEDVRAESRRIEAIVQQFLDFARPRTPRLEPVDVRDAVLSACRRARPAFEGDGVRLEVDAAPASAMLDPVLLDEILDNLLRNAREASTAGSRVAVSVGSAGGQVEIAVQDEGPGVPEELRERVFDLYFTTKPSGSGLGLSLAARMSEAMGGALRLEDSGRRGARFVARFPTEGPRT